jgi:hypothetical protein
MAECHIKNSHRNCSFFDYDSSIHFARDDGYSINKPCYGTALTTILPILFLYLNTVTVTAGTFEP